jgi:hypothetical protein
MIHSALPGFSYPSKPIDTFIPEGYVGSRNTPTLPELREAIAMIRANALQFFDFAPSDWDLSNPEFIKAYNGVAAWVTLRIGYACGIRAITTPLPWARDIHPVYGITKWSDKDSPSGYHTRVLWVPGDVRLELGAYQRLHPRLSKKFEFGAEWSKIPGYLIDPQRRRPELIRPRSLQTYLGKVYPWPCNSHRRVGRQWLRGRVSPSIAYMYMGHWSAEQEPWRQCAGRSVQSLCKELENQIPSLLTDLGLTPLPSEKLKDGN